MPAFSRKTAALADQIDAVFELAQDRQPVEVTLDAAKQIWDHPEAKTPLKRIVCEKIGGLMATALTEGNHKDAFACHQWRYDHFDGKAITLEDLDAIDRIKETAVTQKAHRAAFDYHKFEYACTPERKAPQWPLEKLRHVQATASLIDLALEHKDYKAAFDYGQWQYVAYGVGTQYMQFRVLDNISGPVAKTAFAEQDPDSAIDYMDWAVVRALETQNPSYAVKLLDKTKAQALEHGAFAASFNYTRLQHQALAHDRGAQKACIDWSDAIIDAAAAQGDTQTVMDVLTFQVEAYEHKLDWQADAQSAAKRLKAARTAAAQPPLAQLLDQFKDSFSKHYASEAQTPGPSPSIG